MPAEHFQRHDNAPKTAKEGLFETLRAIATVDPPALREIGVSREDHVAMALGIISIAISITALAVSTSIAALQLRMSRKANLNLIALEHLTRESRTEVFLESEEFVLYRLAAEHSSDAGVFGLPFEARKHVQRIGQYYAGLGMVAAFQATDSALLIGAIHWRVQISWSAIEPYVRTERVLRNNRYLSYFEHLACLARRADKDDILNKQRLLRAEPGEKFAELPARRAKP